MAGLLDWLDSDQGRLGLGLLASAGPRSDGMNSFGRIQEAYGAADTRKRAKAEEEWKKMQMEEARAAMVTRQRAAAKDKQIEDLLPQFQLPAQRALSPLMGEPGVYPASPGSPFVRAGFDRTGYGAALEGIDPIKGMAYQQANEKESTINKFDIKDFTPASVSRYAKTRDYGDLVRLDKLHFGSTGGALKGLNPFTGQEVSSNDITQDPNSVASVAATIRGQNMTNNLGWANNNIARERLNFDTAEGGKPQFVENQFVYKPSAQFPQGRVVSVPGMPDKPLTESQGAATNFGMRSIKADEILTALEKNGSGQMGNTKRFMTAATPGLGMGLDDSMGAMTNWTQSSNQQMSEQARLDFLTAVLRKESGASISPSEHINGQRQYFVQPNDSPEVILQKQNNRAMAVEGLKVQSGPGGKHIKPSFGGGASGSYADEGKESRYQQWKRENGQ